MKNKETMHTCKKCGYIKFAVALDCDLIKIRCFNCFYEQSVLTREPDLETPIKDIEFKPTTIKKVYIRKVLSNVMGFDQKIKLRYNALKIRSKKKRMGCLTFDDFVLWWKETPDLCIYCRGAMKSIHKKGSIITIDRKINTVGYIKENMVKACYICNSTKNEYFTFEQMIRISSRFNEI